MVGLVTLYVTAALPRPLIIADVNIIARVTPLTLNKADTVVIMCVCAISHLMYESGCNQSVLWNSVSPMGDLR